MKKAFDMVPKSEIWITLDHYGVDARLIKGLKWLQVGSSSIVRVVNEVSKKKF